MPDLDLILRAGQVVTSAGVQRLDIGISGETISTLAPEINAPAHEVIDATGLHVFSGVIDSHVHFNEPGRGHWEGFETGSHAFAAGGGTLFFDMPLNSHPPTIDAESFDLKRAAAEKSSYTDFAFWGGLVPENLDKLEELNDGGVIGFKAFMSESGIEDFPRADERTLREGMKQVARWKKLVAVHAESDSMTKQLAQERMAQGKVSIRDYCESRPVRAELEAIARAVDIAGETGCALHIVHVSSGEGILRVLEAQKRGVDVTCETCPHYLILTQSDMEQLGAVAKCAPPLRPSDEQEKLWQQVLNEKVNTLGSDHSPAPPDMKTDANFFKVWGGISSVQHTLPLLITEAHFQRNAALSLIARLLCTNVAKRFQLPARKGGIAVGSDADLALVDLNQTFQITANDLLYRHVQSPYIGRSVRGKVRRTILRGRTIYNDGKIVGKPSGRLTKPNQ